MTALPGAIPSAIWQNDFTADNLIDYANASRQLSSYIRVLCQEGFRHLVVPSRGSVPFIRAAESAWNLELRALPTYQERYQQNMELIGSPFMQELVLPFSADPNDATQTTAAIRRYWSRVLAAIVKRDGKDPYLGFYKVLVERLAKRSWLSALPRDLPQEKFIFIDTVVSGRAICEIIDAFQEVGLAHCYFILIADGNGNEIAPKYKRVIDDLVSRDRCTIICVKRLFTEDRGPAVSGVWSTVYPQMLNAVRNKYAWAKDAYGAGTFYHQVSSSQVEPVEGIGNSEYNMPVTRMYASISTGIFTALHSLHEMDVVEAKLASTVGRNTAGFDSLVAKHRSEIEVSLRRQLDYQLFRFHKTIEELKPYTPLDKLTTKLLSSPRVLQAHATAIVDVSSSHLVRVTFKDNEVADFMREVDCELKLGKDVLADWFRNR
ncbi:hypothetical protein [Aquitalea sp. LB_tupeE]|uniref:hypothetical protein n=1 Tax=Aquitalea sp. LB_tupeE TaxID=2748078 RepID=UPI0015B94378|nr:hypothetical protein [Aquitalea sp. LB_tupeE]NWK80303.1 hypothetical protein [Aquitalea sp. LB_tupeE]